MQGFLSEVARTLYERYGEDVSSLHLLFPSRRAHLFFTDALSSLSDRPLWQPRRTTIDDLMSEISGLVTGDRIRLIAELYKVYSKYHEEPFDRFYFWGDMMLTDFDTIDKYLIDADDLFSNIRDLKELESDLSYLTPEQRSIVEGFWRNFSDGGDNSALKHNFMALWRTLPAIYREYRERLLSEGIAYTGMVHRTAAERIKEGTASLPSRHYVIAGFNALSACEKRLFDYLKNSFDVEFFWDCDDYYTENAEQEAGLFVRENRSRYPAAEGVSHDNFRNIARITAASAVSNVLQCKYAARVLSELAETAPLDKDTAIVLTDENLLEPLMYSLPEGVDKVNVTMGYPLMLTPACSFVERLLDLQSHSRMKGGEAHFYHADVTGLLQHPYIADNAEAARLLAEIKRNRHITVAESVFGGDGLMSVIFRRAGTSQELSEYLSDAVSAVAAAPCEDGDSARRTEFLAVLAENIAKLKNSVEGCGIEVGMTVYVSLLRRHLRTVRIPFEGEPLQGVQIMGILETRNLDFRNVIMLSMDDNNFPGSRILQSSFIPPNLRFAYGMPTAEHHEGVYAYYFYRLIQRCENLYMVYCSHADDKSTGEPSRYIRQLEYESGKEVVRVEAGVDVNLFENEAVEIPKTGRAAEVLKGYLRSENPLTLSPTAFSRYIECPLKFWFRHIARIAPEDEISDTVDNRIFGNIFHKAAQNIYSRITGRYCAGAELRRAIEDADAEVVKAINSEYLHDESADPAEYEGDISLIRTLLAGCLRNVLEYDAAHDDFAVMALESEVSCEFSFENACGGESRVCFKGDSDRIDRLADGTVRIIDYKTGRRELEFRNIESLLAGTAGHYNVNAIKTIMYAMMMYRSRGTDVLPALYYVRSMNDAGYSPLLYRRDADAAGERYSVYGEEFEREIALLLAELFDFSVPFRGCADAKTCTFCDYRAVCNR
ncbi:MAG: PD-(D/E)XK nuclease family protein [Alistipes sp.]|nr:PD-(D/E)XK nuclease family protein [Alistipes sp.]